MLNTRKKQTRVVIFSTVHCAADIRVFHKEAGTLARAGYDVVLFARAPVRDALEGVRIRPLAEGRSVLRRALCSFKLLPAVLREKGDVHHFHDPELIPVGLILRALGKKVVYDAHEDLPKAILGKPYLPGWLRPLLAVVLDPVERLAAAAMSSVVAATDSIAGRFRGATVLHNYPILAYIRRARKAPPPGQECPSYVVYFGTIMRVLGAREMLEAVSAVSVRFPIKLKLFGVFEDHALRCELLTSRAGGPVEYGGIIGIRDVYRNYAGALAGLVLYHPFPNNMDAMPNKLFECMACGIPVIASDFPLWRRIVRDQGCGLVVDPLNVSQIADAITYLLEHPQEASKMGRRGKELVEKKYNWESQAKKLLLLYQCVLREAPRRVPRIQDTDPAPPCGG